jgi:hypothetical protein
MRKVTPKPKNQYGRLKPLSLHPLTPEQALLAFMLTDPKKIKAAERKAQKRKR